MPTPPFSLTAVYQSLRAGRFEDAADKLRQRLAEDDGDADASELLALALLGLRTPEKALAPAQAAVQAHPSVAGFHLTLGRVYEALKRPAEAEAHFREATLLDAGNIDAALLLARLLRRQRRPKDATNSLRRLLRERPENEQALIELGNATRAAKAPVDAETAYRKAIELRPRSQFAHNALARALVEADRPEEALGHAREAVRLDPTMIDARVTVARCFSSLKRWEEAAAQYRHALASQPDNLSVWVALAGVLNDGGNHDAAAEAFESALAKKPDYLPALVNFANLLKEKGNHDRAEALYRKAIEVSPAFPPTYNNLAVLLKNQGRVADALPFFEKAESLDPGFIEASSNRLFAMHYVSDYSPGEIAEAHRGWNERHAAALTRAAAAHSNDRAPERRLRIGYVSPDFKGHSVAFFIEPVLRNHDRTAFEVFAYANQTGGDAVTARLRDEADHWREIARLDDETAAGLIRADGIDILVDLAGHTARNRMLTFARKPAPIQMTWLGYPNGTGLDAMDYRITDSWADPPGQTEAWHREKLLRLETGFLCYQPPADAPPVAPSPARANGHITFGSFNNLAKIGPASVARWSEILTAVPDSKMTLKAPPLLDPGPRDHVANMFAERRIDPGRLEFVGRIPTITAHLGFYEKIDIALDCFPYNGTTTTCEALWMGVPVIAFAGEAHVSRVSASICHSIGADELIADGDEAYVERAISLARDPARLDRWRGELRPMMTASPLLDAERFTQALESAFRRAWREWCADGPRQQGKV